MHLLHKKFYLIISNFSSFIHQTHFKHQNSHVLALINFCGGARIRMQGKIDAVIKCSELSGDARVATIHSMSADKVLFL